MHSFFGALALLAFLSRGDLPAAEPAPTTPALTWIQAQRTARGSNPGLRDAHLGVEQAEAVARSKWGPYLPQLSVSASYTRTGPDELENFRAHRAYLQPEYPFTSWRQH